MASRVCGPIIPSVLIFAPAGRNLSCNALISALEVGTDWGVAGLVAGCLLNGSSSSGLLISADGCC